MAGAGYRTFASGEVLTSTNVQTYLMDQAVQVYSGTAARSSAVPSPSTGMVAYSTATGLQVFNGSAWVAVGSSVLAVDYFVSGGGGGGGKDNSQGGAGGGAGGFVTGSIIIGKATYTVTIGAGGTGATSPTPAVASVGSPSFFINTAVGGGHGGGNTNSTKGGDGASGGGGNLNSGPGGFGISGQGNAGGIGGGDPGYGAGGGGGAAGVGGNGSTTVGGAGGTATTNSYTGSSISYCGGGGGGAGSAATSGGTGGTNAGNGSKTTTGGSGTANRSGGGGGGGNTANGGSGGSGQVVIRYLTADGANFSISTTGSPATGTSGAYTYYQYTATGTFVVA